MPKQCHEPKNSTKLPEEFETTPDSQRPANSSEYTKNVIPDEVPRKDGPGGEK